MASVFVYSLLVFAVAKDSVYSQKTKSDDLECGVATSWFPLVVSKEKVNDAEYPWMAALYVYKDHINNYDFLCTTTLISNRHVITAGHCVQYETISLYDEADLVLVFGRTDLTNWARGSIIRQVAQIGIHPNYTQDHSGHDLVILSFAKPVELSTTIYPICLWNTEWGNNEVVGGGIVAGWGKTKQGDQAYSTIPYKVTMPMVGKEECKKSHEGFPDRISEYTLCAGEKNGAGPCGGDTGAGFAAKVAGRHYLRGVVSYVVPNPRSLCDLSQFVIFSDLSNETDWIRTVIATKVPVEASKSAVKKVELNYRLNYHPDICGTNNGTKNDLEPLEEGDYPWAVTISPFDGRTYAYKCMGTLLTEKHVITAAQCIKNLAGDVTPNFRFLLNFKRFSGEGIETGGVLRMAIHKEYKRPPKSDVAVMIMFMPVRFTANIKPICVWDASDDESEIVGQKGLVIGYSSHKNVDVYSTKSEIITMPLISKETCLKADPRFTTLATENTFCAGNANSSIPVPCTGHAGAGFLVKHKDRWTLRGLVSAALPNEDYTGCDREKYAIFVDLAKYKKWISEQLKID